MHTLSRSEVADYFLQEFRDGKLVYANGAVWRYWTVQSGWLDVPKRAETRMQAGYLVLKRAAKDLGGTFSTGAHRAVWTFFNGHIPDGLEINHINGIKDDNRIENLELVTSSGNRIHAVKTGLLVVARGETHCYAKLSTADVAHIRDNWRSGISQSELSRRFGVSVAHINCIVHNKKRRHS